MKYIIVILLSLCCFITTKAQVTLTQAQIDSLPPVAKQAVELSIKKQQFEDQIKNVSEYASWGSEIGYAVDGALSAVEDHVVSLSETGLGHTVIFLVVWKFIAKDVLGMIVGFCLFLTMLYVIYSINKKSENPEFNKQDEDAQCAAYVCYWLGAAALFIGSLVCAFS